MSTSQITHLSLLSRGIGEVQKTTEHHQKIEIKLEAEVSCVHADFDQQYITFYDSEAVLWTILI